jgi:DNA-directed RNA polymerase subunit beta'
MMMDSGARGNISNFVQLSGMRGLMSKATHEYAALKRQRILIRNTEEIPILSSFKIGLTPFEYFLSTHGARKGLSDTATKTAESGYLTRRLVEAVQDIHIIEHDCNTTKGITVKEIYDSRTGATIEALKDRISGRYVLEAVKANGKTIIKKETLVSPKQAQMVEDLGISEVVIRSAFECNTHSGVCAKCFGTDLTTSKTVEVGEAVGIISAQSIGEPGTQLTMRTFHTGGVAGVADITQGFSRLMEIVDANKNPKSPAIIADIDGKITDFGIDESDDDGNPLTYKLIITNKSEEKSYRITSNNTLRVEKGQDIKAGDKITEGSIRLQELLKVSSRRSVQSYLIKEMQRLYRLQGISINDKYMEIIINQMLSKVKIIDSGDSSFYISQVVSLDTLARKNALLFEQGKKPAFGNLIVMGAKELPLHSDSFLSAASYQRTADALVNASITKSIDPLKGVKENLIIGKKIPVGTGIEHPEGKYVLREVNQDLLDAAGNVNIDLPFEEEEIRIINQD